MGLICCYISLRCLRSCLCTFHTSHHFQTTRQVYVKSNQYDIANHNTITYAIQPVLEDLLQMSQVEHQRPALRQHCDLQPSPHRNHQTGQNSTSSANLNPFIFSFIVIVSLHTFLIFLQVALLVLSYWLHPRDFFRSEHGFVSFKHQHNLAMWWWWVEWGGGSLQDIIILSRFMLGGYPDCHQKYDLRKTEIDHELECQVVRDVPPLPPLHQASLSGFL